MSFFDMCIVDSLLLAHCSWSIRAVRLTSLVWITQYYDDAWEKRSVSWHGHVSVGFCLSSSAASRNLLSIPSRRKGSTSHKSLPLYRIASFHHPRSPSAAPLLSPRQSSLTTHTTQERAAKSDQIPGTRPSGKLSSQLNAQKKQTRNELLGAASQQERRARDVEEGREARNWD